ncbi:MAG: alpha/beta hydrolase [Planctomycetales bacterium]|nr:alpha/beta hydrolase [Planctomycetales bacterium]
MRWLSLPLMTALMLAASGCRVLGPFSPLRPVEQLLIYPQSVAPSFARHGQAGGRQVWVETENRQQLDARYFAHRHPQAVALYCHGNVGTVEKWAVLAGRLSKMHRLSILVFDYRGYGRSTGIAHERGILQDAEAARNWLAQENGIQACDVVLIGRSLGGAVAVDLASNGGARGLILESTFSSLPDVAERHAAWLLPEWNMTQRLNSLQKIKNYSGPLLQSHGDTDYLIPLALAKELFATAPGPKKFIVVPEGTHNDDHIRYCAAERESFLRTLPPVASISANRRESERWVSVQD